jgi:hypothetical protein
MGLFDKLKDAAMDVAKGATETVSGVIGSTVQGGASENLQEATYIPQPVDMRELCQEVGGVEETEPWISIKGNARTLTLSGVNIPIPAELDVFNSYRLKFRDLAIKYSDKAEKEYTERITDLIDFIDDFPTIYHTNLNPLIKRAVDALLSENVWSVTYESFILQHKARYSHAITDYEAVVQGSVNLAIQNQQVKAETKSAYKDLLGTVASFVAPSSDLGSFGTEIMNTVTDSALDYAADSMTTELSTGITTEQQMAIYQAIDPTPIFKAVYADYYCVFLTLIRTLIDNDFQIHSPSDEAIEKANNTFQNLSNPNFPQDKIIDAIVSIIALNPYNVEYYKFLVSRFGTTEEVTSLLRYFGYTDFNNPRLCY